MIAIAADPRVSGRFDGLRKHHPLTRLKSLQAPGGIRNNRRSVVRLFTLAGCAPLSRRRSLHSSQSAPWSDSQGRGRRAKGIRSRKDSEAVIQTRVAVTALNKADQLPADSPVPERLADICHYVEHRQMPSIGSRRNDIKRLAFGERPRRRVFRTRVLMPGGRADPPRDRATGGHYGSFSWTVRDAGDSWHCDTHFCNVQTRNTLGQDLIATEAPMRAIRQLLGRMADPAFRRPPGPRPVRMSQHYPALSPSFYRYLVPHRRAGTG